MKIYTNAALDDPREARRVYGELEAIGYQVALYPVTAVLAAARALEQAYRHLATHGDTSGIADRMMGFDEFGTLVGLDEKYALVERFRR